MAKRKRKRKQREDTPQLSAVEPSKAGSIGITGRPPFLGWLCIAWIVICPFYSVFHGIDFTDMGLAATVNQQAFRDPDSVSLTFLGGWLSVVFGGVWEAVFGGLGYVSLKIGLAVVTWATVGGLYLTLRHWFRRDALLLALAVGTWFISARNMVQWMAYDVQSMSLVTLGGCLLLRGLKRRSQGLLFWAGFVLMAAAFVRLPSLLSLWLGTVIPFYWWLKHDDLKGSLRDCCWCWGGMAAAAASVCLLFVALRHPLVDLDFYAMSQASGHGIGEMLGRLGTEYKFVAKETGIALLIIVGLGAAVAWTRNVWATLIAALAMAILAYRWGMPESRWTVWVNGILIVVCITQMVVLKRRSPLRSCLLWISFWQLFLTPLGSNTGLVKACMGMWFAIPVVLLSVWDWRPPKTWTFMPKGTFQAAVILFAAGVFVGSFRLAYFNSYRDSADRSKMTASVDHPKLRWLKTTPRRARVLQEMMDNVTNPESPAYIKPGEYVLGIGSIAGFHYLTETRPYYYTPWIELLSKEGKLEAAKRALDRDPTPPVLVLCRHSCRNAIWPPPPEMKVPLQKPVKRLRLVDPNAGFNDPRTWELKWAGEFFMVYRAVTPLATPKSP